VGLVQRPGGWDLFFTTFINEVAGMFNDEFKDGTKLTPIMQLIAN